MILLDYKLKERSLPRIRPSICTPLIYSMGNERDATEVSMSQDADARLTDETTAGNYFISNYPPYSFWNRDQVAQAHAALDRAPRPDAPLGIYVHIPFCRKRCHFCYFKVYTGKDSSEVDRYLEALVGELALYAGKCFIGGRRPRFI